MYRTSNFNRNSKMMHMLKKIISILIYITIIPIIIYNLTLMMKSYINPIEIPDFLGFKSFVIVSESMETTIMKGDAIFVKNARQEDIKINDIISFHNKDEIITHRIVEIVKEEGKTKYITKGDNNRKEDKEHITYDKIEGVYQFKISGFGKIVEILKDKVTLIILLIILVLISLLQVRTSKKRLKRKEKRYEYNKRCNSFKNKLKC